MEEPARLDYPSTLVLCGMWASSLSMHKELVCALDVPGYPPLEFMLDRRNFPWTYARFRTHIACIAFRARLKAAMLSPLATQWMRCLLPLTLGNFINRRQRICGNSQHDRKVTLHNMDAPPDELLRHLSGMTWLLTARKPFLQRATRRATFMIFTCCTVAGARALCDTFINLKLSNGCSLTISCTRRRIDAAPILHTDRPKQILTSHEARLCEPPVVSANASPAIGSAERTADNARALPAHTDSAGAACPASPENAGGKRSGWNR